MSRRPFFFTTIQSGSRYVTFHGAVVLLPTLPASARTVAMYVQVPTGFDAYVMDNRDRMTGAGNEYIIKNAISEAQLYVSNQADSAGLGLLASGQWVRAFLECSALAAPTIFGRYSWNAGGASGVYNGFVSIAEMAIYDRVLTDSEKADSAFPAAGLLARYDFQNVATTYINNAAASIYPLVDRSGNGRDAQLGVLQDGSITEVF